MSAAGDIATAEPTDPRVARSCRAVVEATIDLLTTEGLAKVNYEAVAARANVAKSTIYRHFPDRIALLTAAIDHLKSVAAVPVTDDLRADVLILLQGLYRILHTEQFGRAFPAILAEAEADDEVREALARHSRQRRQAFLDRLRLAVRRGELPKGTNVDRLGELLIGPVFLSRMTPRITYKPKDLALLVDLALAGARHLTTGR